MEDIDAIARASLNARMPAITARAVARAIAKGVIQESVDKAGQKGDDAAVQLIGSLLVRVASVATERADTRSWLTLPANVQLARLALPPGSYDCNGGSLGNERTGDCNTGIPASRHQQGTQDVSDPAFDAIMTSATRR